jgi:HPt (histidine-containing phosphotransfer) domain-containing protein
LTARSSKTHLPETVTDAALKPARISDQLEQEMRSLASVRLLQESPLAELTHVVLAFLAGYIVWEDTPYLVTTPVDVAGFRAEMREAGVEEVVDDFTATFLRDAPGRVTALEQAVGGADAVKIERATHAFKSSAGAIRANGLAEMLKQLELPAREGKVADAPDRMVTIEAAAKRAMDYLRTAGFSPDRG